LPARPHPNPHTGCCPHPQSDANRAGLEQYAIKAFAEALEVVPHALAENAGVKAKEVISKLYSAHKAGDKNAGLDNEADTAGIRDACAANIVDHFLTKHWGLIYATRAACTVLRVDQVPPFPRAVGLCRGFLACCHCPPLSV
jgi:T-complex protein 1 subunit theta